MSPRLRIVCAALLFSTGGAVIKAADFNGWQIASFRSGLAAVTLFILVPAARRGFGWKTALIGVVYAATVITFVLANRLTTSANTIYLQSTAPLYLLLLGPLVLKEPIRRRDVPVMLAVLAGLVLVFLGADVPSLTAPNPARGNLLALGSGLTYAVLLCSLRGLGRHGDPGDRTIAAIILGNAIACVAALPMALPAGVHSLAAWSVIVYLGVFQISAAYLMVATGLRHVPALEASLLLLVETAFNPLWSWLFLHEVPAVLALVGGAVIIGATVVQAAWTDPRAPVPGAA